MEPSHNAQNPPWRQRVFPENGSSVLPFETSTFGESVRFSPAFPRIDLSAFMNSMDDASFAYMSLIREYASRPLQGRALEYENFYRAMVSQQAEDESLLRVSVIEFENDGLKSKTFDSYHAFRVYLENDTHNDSLRRLIILEDLPVRFVCLLGSHLRIHPCIFARQYSTEDYSVISENITAFPSVDQTSTQDGLDYTSDYESLHGSSNRRSFILRYPITMPAVSEKQHPDPELCPPWYKASERHKDQSAYPKFIVERSIDTPTRHTLWDTRGEISELGGQVTYWYHSLPNGGWNAVLLVDPCLKDPEHLALINGALHLNGSRIVRYPELEDHEKVDLAPNPLQWHPSAAFTKFKLHDDILTHFSVADASPGQNPLAVTPFVRGFVISKWVAHLNHISRSYANTRSALFSRTSHDPQTENSASLLRHKARWGADWEEWLFETLMRFTTDLALYRLGVENDMHALGIDVEDAHSFGFVGKREAQMWRYLRSSCIDFQNMFQQLTNSYTQVIALREAQASTAQAKLVRWLTMLGTLFVPLSVVAGIMSMGDEFLPGKERFWVYPTVVGAVLSIMGLLLSVILGWEKASRQWQKIKKQRVP